jgi:hypothetical protein
MWTDHGLVFPTEVGTPCDPRSFLRVIEVAATSLSTVESSARRRSHR